MNLYIDLNFTLSKIKKLNIINKDHKPIIMKIYILNDVIYEKKPSFLEIHIEFPYEFSLKKPSFLYQKHYIIMCQYKKLEYIIV